MTSRYRAFLLALSPVLAWAGRPDPAVQHIVGEVSRERIAATMKRLAGFETRGNFTEPDQSERGIGAARRWIYDQFRACSPRIEVSFEPWKVKKDGRIFRDVEVVNVVAVLPGTKHPEMRVIVSGHYDSLNIVTRPGAADFRATGDSVTDAMDNEKSAVAPAPGVNDDASGVAVVLELARVMSAHNFDKTLVFVAFAGEEIGLVGSTLYADHAKERNEHIEAVLNNDIVGNDVDSEGRARSGSVNVFSEEPVDSPSRELARYVSACAQLYIRGFNASPVFRSDRFSRGGDHLPFAADGFAAVRFTAPAENLALQHTANDTFDKASPAYTTKVARVNAATAASLALAPAPPDVMREITTGTNIGKTVPNISRGSKLSDAVLRWKDNENAAGLAGYVVVMRSTTAPYWQREIWAGQVTEYTLPGVSIDEVTFGVKAVNTNGNESLVAPYVAQPFPRRPIELQ